MDLSIYSVWGAGVAFLVAWLTAHALTRVFGAPPSDGRFATIDGLRGFLAFSVFMHHNVIWFVYLRTGQWVAPQSALFRHFGESAVALFFMITAFLFTTKVLNSRERPIDWTRLYVGRLTRLFPMYAVAVTVVWVMAWLLTGHARNVGWGTLLDEFVHWLAFTIRDHPDVNGLAGTSILIAGVTWSLPYEWWFYLSLPFLALVLRRRPPATWLLLGAVTVLLVTDWWQLDPARLLPFVGGVLAAWLVRDERFRTLAAHRLSGLVVVAALVGTVLLTPSAFTPLAVALLTVAFAFVSAGTDVFGILTSPTSRLLGEVTYSMYLIHGLILTTVFRFIVGTDVAAIWSPLHHWVVILGLAVVLVLLSYAAFRLVEVPGQRLTPVLLKGVERVRRLLERPGAPSSPGTPVPVSQDEAHR